MPKEGNGRELAKDVLNDIAQGYRAAVDTDENLDSYQKANARVGIAVGQLLATLAVDAIADWANEE